MRILLTMACVLLCVSSSAGAQQGDWGNLTTLQAGSKVTVVDSNLKSIPGKLVRLSDRDITVRVGNQEQLIPREHVYRVTRKTHRRNALIGFAAGAAAGFLVVAISPELGTGTCEQGSCFDMGIASAMALFGGGIGAGIGAAIPHTTTIYQSGPTPPDR